MFAFVLVAAFLAGAFFAAAVLVAVFFAGAFLVAVFLAAGFFSAGAFFAAAAAAGLASVPALVAPASFTGPEGPVGGGEVSLAFRDGDYAGQMELAASTRCTVQARHAIGTIVDAIINKIDRSENVPFGRMKTPVSEPFESARLN